MEISPYFNPQNDLFLHHQFVEQFGSEKAKELLLPIYAENFHSQAWEVTRLKKPFEFYYYIERGENGVRLVNGSDSATHTDILVHTNPNLQNGLEYTNMANARAKLLSADIGTSVVWISPKNEIYPDTQINVGEIIDKKLIHMRQFQSRELDLSNCARLLNCVATKEAVMTTIRSFNDHLDNEGMWQMIEGLTGVKLSDPIGLAESIREKSQYVGLEYYKFLDQGPNKSDLRVRQIELLKDTIDYKTFQSVLPMGGLVATSCGFLDFGMPKTGISGIMTEVKTRNWCSGCQIENSCTAKCFRCGGILSSKPVSYI